MRFHTNPRPSTAKTKPCASPAHRALGKRLRTARGRRSCLRQKQPRGGTRTHCDLSNARVRGNCCGSVPSPSVNIVGNALRDWSVIADQPEALDPSSAFTCFSCGGESKNRRTTAAYQASDPSLGIYLSFGISIGPLFAPREHRLAQLEEAVFARHLSQRLPAIAWLRRQSRSPPTSAVARSAVLLVIRQQNYHM